MVHERTSWRMRTWRAVLALTTVALPLAVPGLDAVQAQSIMRTPNLNVGSRIGPSIAPPVAPRIDSVRIDPNLAGRVGVGLDRATTSTRLGCSYAYRGSDGQCQDQVITSGDGGGNTGLPGKGKSKGPRRDLAQTALNLSARANELVAEYDSSLSEARAGEMARRHHLVLVGSQSFPLIGATIGLFRINDRRSVDAASRDFAGESSVHLVQPNYRYLLQDQQAVLTEGDPAQYALAKLRLPQAHTLAHGANVTIAVIDSGIDVRHPELAGSIADSFDALGSKEGPHVHGTGIAGAIVAHGRLMGSAPSARILAIRAFGMAPAGEESTSFVILKGLDYAVAHGAQIINMSFAGPKDALIERGIAAVAAKGIVMVAAAGNAGAKSPPLYPAANPAVIAVSATDAQDRLFTASNRGSHIAISAPGVDIFLPAPDEKYQVTSGTSFSAAYVSGLVALILERNPALKPDQVRATVMGTARDLGSPGRDDQFGAGEADAYAAVSAVAGGSAVPVAAASGAPAAETAGNREEIPATRALNGTAATMASDKPATGEANRPAEQ
jgi:subtilisin family serine protease